MAAFSGFYESHKPPPSGDARGIVLLHRHGHTCYLVPHIGLHHTWAFSCFLSPDTACKAKVH